MAGITLAKKYEKKTSDLIVARRKTSRMTNDDWSWEGTNSIIVTTLSDPVMGDYNPNGPGDRYGNASEVEDTTQEWPLIQDRSWTKTMDKKNIQDAMGIRQPGKYLAQATKNVLVPEIDAYILQIIVTAGATADRDDIVADGATSAANAYTNFLDINSRITDDECPTEGRIAGMTAQYYNYLKQGGFVLDSDSAYRDRKTGNLGTVDGCEVVIIPSKRMPVTSGAIDLLITHPSVTAAPEKLVDYTLHKNPVGISGYKLEYRHRYDGFADINRLKCIGMHAVA